ncbi:hypothetical protein OUZ56_010042 [Daphnia magna]|uniref:Uncharacterized protein n=1 Tax=Daphnia magna TaxID=35525 RepID=A0ABR0AHM0_9CRUS|nr:hypothetical protein OUZ56_010042 [Daphnia magna]
MKNKVLEFYCRPGVLLSGVRVLLSGVGVLLSGVVLLSGGGVLLSGCGVLLSGSNWGSNVLEFHCFWSSTVLEFYCQQPLRRSNIENILSPLLAEDLRNPHDGVEQSAIILFR